jgi:hydrogenase maturation protease
MTQAQHIEPRRPELAPVRVIGVGSPFGADALGLEAARRLAADTPPGAEVIAVDRPGERLLDLFAGAAAVILIDAARAAGSDGDPGTVHDLDLEAVADAGARPFSSHGFGVAETIALARALGRLPPRGRVLAVEVDPSGTASDPALQRALADVCARARSWVAKYVAPA